MDLDDNPKPKKNKIAVKNNLAIPIEDELTNSTAFKGKSSLFFIMK
jgi:hypothetical protein